MADGGMAVAAGLALLSGPPMFFRGFGQWRMSRLIENTPTAKIRSMAMGLVEVNGVVAPRSRVTAPFTGRECAYWEIDVSAAGRRRGSWRVVHRNQSGNPFFLRDETGTALVYPHGATTQLAPGVEEECLGLGLPDLYDDYLKAHPGAVSPVTRLAALRFRERRLDAGQAVYVMGTAMPKTREHRVTVDDEMEATGTDGPVTHAQPMRSLDAEIDAVVRRGENERTFIISESSERSLVWAMQWKAAAMVLGGPVLTVFGLIYWLDAVSRGWRLGG